MSLLPASSESGPSGWFNQAEPGETQDALKRVYDIERTHTYFTHTYFRKIFGQDFDQDDSKRVMTKEELFTRIESLGFRDLKATANTVFTEAGTRLESYQHERTSGSKTKRGQMQRAVKSFADFVDTYSGIVGLIKQAGAPYGDAAFNTLYLLLSVVINKSKNEKLFVDSITDLRRAFPRLHILNNVYPSTTLEVCVADVYVEVIVFARKTIAYYSSFCVRLLCALSSSSSNDIHSSLDVIKRKVADVNKEAMVLLHARGDEILKGVQALNCENEGLKQKISSLQTDVRDLKHGNDRLESSNAALHKQLERLDLQLAAQAKNEENQFLDQMQVALDLAESPARWPETQVGEVAHVLEKVFPASFPSSVVLPPFSRSPWLRFNHMTEQQLFGDVRFVEWHNSEQSSLLFMCGRTQREARKILQSTCSWLSSAAVFTARKVLQRSRDPTSNDAARGDLCVFYTCHAHEYSRSEGSKSIHAFAAILWSLYRDLVLSSQRRTDFKTRASSICHNRGASSKAMIEGLTTLLIEMLCSACNRDDRDATIWIILDRIDECELRLRDIMNELVRLVSTASRTIKILVTADAGYKGGKWDALDVSNDAGKQVVFRDWDQRRIATHERAPF